MKTLISLLLFAGLGLAQTTINGGRTILGPWDASGATTTKPIKSGTAAPGTCAVGELFYDTDATAGSNLFGCTATNTWTLLGGTYSLPTATADILGGIKVGANLTITDGVLAAAGGSITCDPFDLTKFCFFEDFATGGNTNGATGAAGLAIQAIDSGTFGFQSVTASPGITQHPGVFKITSTTVANSGGSLRVTNNATGWDNVSDLLNEEWEIRWIAKLDSITDTRIRIGMSVSSTNLVPSTSELSMFFRYDTDASYADNTKNTTGSWVAQFCAYSGGNCASDTAGVYSVFNTTPDTNWHLFTLAKSGSTYSWTIDAGTPKTMCASGCDMVLPSISSPETLSAPNPSVLFGISSTTQRIFYVDYVSMKLSGLTRY